MGNRDRGQELFEQHCTGCHGSNGAGVSGHNLQDLKHRMTYEQTVVRIKDPIAPMPKFFPTLLSEHDVREVAEYLQHFQ